jgi:hypothetical protein
MSTHYTRPDCAEYRAPFPIVSRDVSRYRSAAEICAAITAAADGAPEFSDACYAPGAADWHGPTRGASFAHFLYCIDGARGSYSVSNTRENLLTLARKVNTIRAAFDGKPRRAPAAKRAPTSAPHVAARALMADGNARDAIQLAENSGAVFFGAAAIGAPGAPIPYMGCETVEFFGQSFTIGRAIKTGRFFVLHTSTALSVSGSAHRDGFKTHSAALDWIETESACDAWRDKLHTALHGRSEFDQTAARARYFEDETAPVETIEPAAVESAPDVPIEQPAAPVIEQPAPVDVWPPLQPMMRPAEHIARLPLFARLAIERIDADSDLRTGAKLDELLRAYAAQYRETCDDHTRQSAHAIASRRFWNFRPDDAPTEPAAIVPAADPAPVCEPVESPALQATRAHPWMTHAARRVYWVHCETARFSRELGPLPFGAMFRRPRSPGFMPDFLAPEIRAHRAAVAAAVRADRAAKRAPADAPRADAAPVDTGAAPGGWMRPATGMLSESETRAWPSAEPIESAPTPGYAFPGHALPATITGPSAGQRGMILYHGSNSKTPLSSIEDRGVFGGLFASPRAASAESHGEALYRMTVPDASIMGMSDDLPFDKVKAVIKKNSAISPEHADDFAEMVLSAKSAFDSEIPEDALMKATRSTDLGEADWELQRLRGIVAKSFGYKAVEMPDEHGMSYLVLGGAVKPRPANDLARSLARGSTIIK